MALTTGYVDQAGLELGHLPTLATSVLELKAYASVLGRILSNTGFVSPMKVYTNVLILL